MKKHLPAFVVGCELLLVASLVASARAEAPKAAAGESAAVWEFRYDSALDAQLKADARAGELKITAKKNVITATASGGGLSQTGKWTGLFINGRANLVQLREDGLNGYARVCIAREVKPGLFVGTWYDNDGGSGDLELALKKK